VQGIGLKPVGDREGQRLEKPSAGFTISYSFHVLRLAMSDKPLIQAFFDEATNTISYLVADPKTKRAAVIDPVLDYDPKSATVDIRSARAILAAANEGGYLVEWSLETRAHADHLSGSPYVKAKTGAKIGIGERYFGQCLTRPI
jgi:glyoxylase-like metal-dependent hydrolase (beta-lactamase superfamily II)